MEWNNQLKLEKKSNGQVIEREIKILSNKKQAVLT